MPSNSHTMLAPTYYRHFRCTGSECPDSCCYGWRVDLSQQMFERYRAIEEKVNGHLVSEVIRKNDASTESHFGIISLTSNGACPFLTDDRLCAMQQRFGEDYLSLTCAGFPRHISRVFGKLEASLSLACPVAADLVLSNTEKMTFEMVPLEPGTVPTAVSTGELTRVGAGRFFEPIRELGIQLVQKREFHIHDRLLVLGLAAQAMQQRVDRGEHEQISNEIEKVRRLLVAHSPPLAASRAPVDDQLMVTIALQLLVISQSQGFQHEKLQELVELLVRAIHAERGAPLDEVTERYRSIRQVKIAPFLNRNAHIVENYLVNRIFHESFPLNKPSPFEAFVELVTNYSIIKLLMIGPAAANELDNERAIGIVQVISKAVEHSKRCLRGIESFLVSNGYNTMGHMATLIKG